MYITDGVVILGGVIIYIANKNMESVFYAVIAMVLSGIAITKLTLEGKTGYTFFIISEKYQEIIDEIFKSLERGVTKIEAVGAYSNQKKDLIICTIYRRNEYRLKEIIRNVDPNAFTFYMKTHEAIGEGFMSRPE